VIIIAAPAGAASSDDADSNSSSALLAEAQRAGAVRDFMSNAAQRAASVRVSARLREKTAAAQAVIL
jgi:hypothetical protein